MLSEQELSKAVNHLSTNITELRERLDTVHTHPQLNAAIKAAMLLKDKKPNAVIATILIEAFLSVTMAFPEDTDPEIKVLRIQGCLEKVQSNLLKTLSYEDYQAFLKEESA